MLFKKYKNLFEKFILLGFRKLRKINDLTKIENFEAIFLT